VRQAATKKAGKSKDPLAKFGGICCDCETGKIDEKCKGLKLPHLKVYNTKSRTDFEYNMGADFDMDKFVAYTLEKLEYVQAEKESKQEL